MVSWFYVDFYLIRSNMACFYGVHIATDYTLPPNMVYARVLSLHPRYPPCPSFSRPTSDSIVRFLSAVAN